jgi:hypothetical protein
MQKNSWTSLSPFVIKYIAKIEIYEGFLNVYRIFIMDWIVSLQNSYVEVLTFNVNVFEDKAFTKVAKVKWDWKVGK